MATLPDGTKLPGKLFIVEGIDGSGKSTQLDLLHKWLVSRGYLVAFTEWNSSPVVRQTTKRGKAKQLFSPTSFSLLHAADLADRIEQNILAGFARGCHRAGRPLYLHRLCSRCGARGRPRVGALNLSFCHPSDPGFLFSRATRRVAPAHPGWPTGAQVLRGRPGFGAVG